MQKLRRVHRTAKVARTAIIYVSSLALIAGYPLASFAEDAPAAPVTSQTEAPNTGASSLPQTSPTYTYNKETGHWDTNEWRYDPVTGKYQPVTPPAPPVTQVTPDPATTPDPTIITPDSSTKTSKDSKSGETTVNNQTGVTNTLNSDAKSGDAAVTRNTNAGDAKSGDAAATTTILNNVNSTVSATENQKVATFVKDIYGDVHGDIMLQPTMLKAMLEAGANGGKNTTNITNTSSLTNNVNLNATSGNASVTDNTKAGSATSGSANTVANVVNIINSMVAANQSFVGTINIYGSLDGDILIAPDFIPQMIASNKDLASKASAPTVVNANDTQSIINNVELAAKSGQAAVTGNTSAGNAKTGDANTNVVIFNLTGHEIVAKNSLLVFVNVLGKWVGVIVDAPEGATAAAIGNGVTSNKAVAPDLVVEARNNAQITNNITLASQSGNALVAGNTRAGDATSGNATASANLANIINTSFGLSDWFGVLFINVFGNWYGSFGVDTAAGSRPAPISGGGGSGGNSPAKEPMRVINFIPHPASAAFKRAVTQATVITPHASGGAHDATGGDAVLAAAPASQPGNNGTGGSAAGEAAVPSSEPALVRDFRLPLLAGSTFVMAVSLAALKRLSQFRKHGSAL